MPSRMADRAEFRAFAETLGQAGGGVIMATCGNDTDIPFLGELAALSKGATVYAPLLHYSNQPERAIGIARECAAERDQGRRSIRSAPASPCPWTSPWKRPTRC
ncbi:MAG: hypothetical protein ACMVY4_04905 [Minwuia sp.]|uniref:hypothetical protein n=1 Tax=Minwuia sp. TaxID=2493630 RepID=UPI003A842FEC